MGNRLRVRGGLILIALCLLMGVMPVSASVWVDEDYNKVYNEAQLRLAVSRASYNDVVRLRNTIRLSEPLYVGGGKNLTLSGDPIKWEAGADKKHESMIIVEKGGTLHLKDITVNGNKNVGVIYVHSGASLYIESGAVVKNGNTKKVGGGIYNLGTLTMQGGTVYNCVSGEDGGGVYNIGSFVMEDGIISDNKAEAGNGGGLYNDGSFYMDGGKFSDNIAGGNGSGVYQSASAKLLEFSNTPVISDGFYLAKKQKAKISIAQFDAGAKVRLEGVEDPKEWREIATGAKEEDLKGFSVKNSLQWELEYRGGKILLGSFER